MVTPFGQGLLHQGAIKGMHFDSVIAEPARKPTHDTLRIDGSAVHIGRPSRETDSSRLDEAHHHPGQCFEMPTIDPVLMWAEDIHQRMIETRRVLHVDPPWKLVVPKRVSTDPRSVEGHASLLSANQLALSGSGCVFHPLRNTWAAAAHTGSA